MPFYIVSVLLSLIVVNLLILNVKVFTSEDPTQKIYELLRKTPPSEAPLKPAPQASSSSALDFNCNEKCQAYIASVVKSVSTQSAILSPTLSQIQYQAPQKTTKEAFIPLGSGSTSKNTWDDTGTDTPVDSAYYGTIDSAYFIAQIKNQNGNGIIEARLYNVTDGYAVYGSNISLSGSPSQILTAGPFAFPVGNKVYRIQIRSGLESYAEVVNGKIRLLYK